MNDSIKSLLYDIGIIDSIINDTSYSIDNYDELINRSNKIALLHNDFDVNENAKVKYNKRLKSIFNEIKLGESTATNQIVNISLFDEFSKNNESNIKANKEELIDYIKKLKKTLDSLNKSGVDYYHRLYAVLKNYTSCLPYDLWTDNDSTISYFDQVKLRTAIYKCLKVSHDDKPFILIDYDLSGIQKFIYQITEQSSNRKNITKSLRTRSYYLNILADLISYYIVYKFNLGYENILFSSSGRGKILLPNIDGFEDKINEILKTIEKCLFYRHKGALSYNISYTKVTEKELMESSLSDLTRFENMIELNNKKQKFKSVFKNSFEYVNRPLSKLCNMCNQNETNHEVCSFCNSLIALNDNVIAKGEKCKFVIEYIFDDDKTTNDFLLDFDELGKIAFHNSTPKEVKENRYYVSINEHLLGDSKNYARSINSSISFEDIADKSVGDDKIAVIKMDVDSLGYIFLRGIKDEETNISKSLILSRQVDYFFSKELVNIVGEDVYINYAGGDDLVLIVPASESLNIVERINKEFNKYTSNTAFKISAGIEIFNHKSPARYAIERSEENLEKSKGTEFKNSFTTLEVSISNDKLNKVNNLIKNYIGYLEDKKMSRTGLYNIYSALIMSLEHSKPLERYMRFVPNIAYSIERNVSDKEVKNILKNTFVFTDINYELLEEYKVILGYVLMITRED